MKRIASACLVATLGLTACSAGDQSERGTGGAVDARGAEAAESQTKQASTTTATDRGLAASYGPWSDSDIAGSVPVHNARKTSDASPKDPGGIPAKRPQNRANEGEPASDRVTPIPLDVDACTLVMPEEFAAWAGPSGAQPERLEDEVCGWRNRADDRRLALGVFQFEAGSSFRPPDVQGEPVPGVGESATWISRWPVPQSSTLIVGLGQRELVLELSHKQPTADSDLRAAAVRFAKAALGRVS